LTCRYFRDEVATACRQLAVYQYLIKLAALKHKPILISNTSYNEPTAQGKWFACMGTCRSMITPNRRIIKGPTEAEGSPSLSVIVMACQQQTHVVCLVQGSGSPCYQISALAAPMSGWAGRECGQVAMLTLIFVWELLDLHM
jgi:hypothetical protein